MIFFLLGFMLGAAAVACWFYAMMPWLRPMRIKTLGLAMLISFALIEGVGFLQGHIANGAYIMAVWMAITFALLTCLWWLNLLAATVKNGGRLP